MSELLCKFCNKIFSTKIVLINHQKTAKYCLKKQGTENKEYKCPHCPKILSTPLRLNTHINTCKLKDKNEINKYKQSLFEEKTENLSKDKIIEELRSIIKDLKIQLEKANNTISEIAKQPKTITTNTNNDNRIRTQNNTQTFDINDVNKITKVLENHLTPQVLSKGQKGVAEMLKEYLLKNENGELIYGCTDVSRQKFEFINKHGFIETDPKATKLLSSLNNANIFDVTHSTGKKLWEKEDGTVNHDSQNVHILKVGEVLDINNDSSKFRSHLANITAR